MSTYILLKFSTTLVILLSSAYLHDFPAVDAQATANRVLTITAYGTLLELYTDGVKQVIPNGHSWNTTDSVSLDSDNRLLALQAVNIQDRLCGGVLASVTGGYLLTNNKWKCQEGGVGGNWMDLGYDDSSWLDAVEHGNNGDNLTGCNNEIPEISAYARWIWPNSANGHTAIVAHCRGYLPICETDSLCLNNGLCLQNDVMLCDCLPGYGSRFCETGPTAESTTGPGELPFTVAESSRAGMIIGIVVGCVLVVMILTLLIVFVLIVRPKKLSTITEQQAYANPVYHEDNGGINNHHTQFELDSRTNYNDPESLRHQNGENVTESCCSDTKSNLPSYAEVMFHSTRGRNSSADDKGDLSAEASQTGNLDNPYTVVAVEGLGGLSSISSPRSQQKDKAREHIDVNQASKKASNDSRASENDYDNAAAV